MRRISPPESVHALDLDALRRPEHHVLVGVGRAALLGCGALKELDDRTRRGQVDAHARSGCAAAAPDGRC